MCTLNKIGKVEVQHLQIHHVWFKNDSWLLICPPRLSYIFLHKHTPERGTLNTLREVLLGTQGSVIMIKRFDTVLYLISEEKK